ncbi:hypothetical protein F4859DRAFT_174836 [Xylaria cf. heliscus]|nr:hypothetical protein F4859DRAFT_174836 [Xylaria cf. heliscus]
MEGHRADGRTTGRVLAFGPALRTYILTHTCAHMYVVAPYVYMCILHMLLYLHEVHNSILWYYLTYLPICTYVGRYLTYTTYVPATPWDCLGGSGLWGLWGLWGNLLSQSGVHENLGNLTLST